MRQSLKGIKRDQSYTHLANSSTTNTPTSFLNEVQFTGAISDSNTGLYYMNARYYNPNTGRFLSQDSYKGSAYEPWTQNLYSYCGNNPINMVDPTGHVANTLLMMTDGGNGKRQPGLATANWYKRHYTELSNAIGNPSSNNSSDEIENSNDSFMEEWIWQSTVQNQLDRCHAWENFNEDVPPEELLTAAWNSLNIDIGVGGGIGGSVKAFNLVEINVVPIKTDFWHLQLDEGKLQTGWKLKSAINAQIGPGGAGYYYTSFDPDPKGGPKIEEHGFNDNLGYGFELYFGLGIEINVGFSLLVLLEELDKMSNN